MDYIEWVERVFDAAIACDDGAMGRTSAMAIAGRLGLGEPTWDDFSKRTDPRLEGLMDAIGDLEAVGVTMGNISQVTVTQQARDVAHVGFRTAAWPAAFESVLHPSAEGLLRAVVARSVDAGPDFARVVECRLGEAWADANPGSEPGYETVMRSNTVGGDLREKGLLKGRWAGSDPLVWPSVFGVIRATGAEDLEWQERLPRLVDEWETTSVEFKRELDLGTDEGKRRLVRSALALANTKASGPRYLVVGYDPKTHGFVRSVDASVTGDRIEDVLAAYLDPVPEARYRTVGVAGGTAGIVEVLRNPEHLPYRTKRVIRGVAVGVILVRHGSHIEPPSQREEADLIREGMIARGEQVPEVAEE